MKQAEDFLKKNLFIDENEDTKDISIPFDKVVKLISLYKQHNILDAFVDLSSCGMLDIVAKKYGKN